MSEENPTNGDPCAEPNPEFEDVLGCPCCTDGGPLRRDREGEFEGIFDPQVIVTAAEWQSYRVACTCGMTTGWYASRNAAIESWNRRGGKSLNNDGGLRFTEANAKLTD